MHCCSSVARFGVAMVIWKIIGTKLAVQWIGQRVTCNELVLKVSEMTDLCGLDAEFDTYNGASTNSLIVLVSKDID